MSEEMKSTTDVAEGAATEKKKASLIIKMIIGSVLGLLLFCVPLPWGGGSSTMLLSIMKTAIENQIAGILRPIALAIMVISLVGTIYMFITKDKEHGKFVKAAFAPTIVNLIVRACAVVISAMVFFEAGPEWLLSPDTGGMMFTFLMPSLILFFYLGTILLYFLTDYGLMELVGSLVERVFRPLFRLPARSAVLCISGFFGSGTVQILAADAEHRRGYLTRRETSIISVGFCTITFGAMFAYSCGIGGLDDKYFAGLFGASVLAAVVSVIIMSRIPPLSKIPNTYYEGNRQIYQEGKGGFKVGFNRAYSKVKEAPSFPKMVVMGSKLTTSICFEVIPMIIVMGTIVTVLATYTPVFDWVATPFVPVLKLIGVPEAAKVAPSLFTGFADLLLPFIGAAGVESQLATFILCVVAISQVICMTETGMIISKSSAPISVGKLFLCFLEKTVIALLIGLLVGRLMGIPV